MSFLYPAFLFTAAAIAIPIIIHFFNLKSYKTVYFSNISLLRKVKEESKVRSQLKHLLVLLMRVLAILSLAFLFAQPVMKDSAATKPQAQKRVAVYLDNSFSMEALGEKGMLLEVAKNRIRRIVEAHELGTVFTLITNDQELKHQEFVSPKQLIKQISEVEGSPVFLPVSSAIPQVAKRFGRTEKKTVYLVSDFQKVSADWDRLSPDSTLDLRLVPVSAQHLGNVYVDSVWFEKPSHLLGADEQLFVRVVNLSENEFENLPVTLHINEAVRTVANVQLKPNGRQTLTLNFSNRTEGEQRGRVSIEDYPITFDNDYNFSYKVVKSVSMLVVNPEKPSEYFSALGNSADMLAVEQQPVGSLNVSELFTFSIVVFNGIENLSSGILENVKKYLEQGGSVLVFPSTTTTAAGGSLAEQLGGLYFGALDTVRSEMNPKLLQHPFFKASVRRVDANLQMPFVKDKYLTQAHTTGRWEKILWDRRGYALMLRKKSREGQLYISTFNLNDKDTDFMIHQLFASVMLTIPIQSLGDNANSFTVGEDKTVVLKTKLDLKDQLLKLKKTDSQFSFVPTWFVVPSSQQLTLRQMNLINEAGFYSLKMGERTIGQLAFNHSRKESDSELWQRADLESSEVSKQFGSWKIFEEGEDALLTEEIQELQSGEKLWRLFLIAALIFLLAEVTIIRFWK